MDKVAYNLCGSKFIDHKFIVSRIGHRTGREKSILKEIVLMFIHYT